MWNEEYMLFKWRFLAVMMILMMQFWSRPLHSDLLTTLPKVFWTKRTRRNLFPNTHYPKPNRLWFRLMRHLPCLKSTIIRQFLDWCNELHPPLLLHHFFFAPRNNIYPSTTRKALFSMHSTWAWFFGGCGLLRGRCLLFRVKDLEEERSLAGFMFNFSVEIFWRAKKEMSVEVEARWGQEVTSC